MNGWSGRLRRFRRAYEAYPATAICLTIAVALFVAVRVEQTVQGLSAEDALWHCGAVTQLAVQGEPELKGLLDLWDGQVARIGASAFHHANWLHLALNALAIGFLGTLLEARMGSAAYAAFLGASVFVSFLPELLLEHMAVGLSGVAYAQFGALLVLRRSDARLTRLVSDRVIQAGLGWLVLCFLLTWWGVLMVANWAHVAGLAYGWLVGRIFLQQPATRKSVRLAVLAGHGLILVGVYFVTHPVWLGRYHWYLGNQEADWARRMQHWRTALKYDPGLTGLWRTMALAEAQKGDLLAAWRTVLEGIRLNRSDEKGCRLAQFLWHQMRSPVERREARRLLARIFGAEQDRWKRRLGLLTSSQSSIAADGQRILPPWVVIRFGQPPPPWLEDSRWRELLEDSLLGLTPRRTLPPVNPDAPHSAGEGIRL
ncbi:MAG: rhomboid family intramembrane serine protease [Planctomycetes bacterium]|nr:rhomboid family intramembrane serine protease [Planctomycetota bacterium]